MHSSFKFVLVALLAGFTSPAFAVGECSDEAFGPGNGSTPCCADTAMAGGGTCYVPANQSYSFTIKSIGFERSDGVVTTLGSNTSFNAASADAGNVIGNFISGGTLTAGTYVAVISKVSLNATTSNSAVTTLDGRTCSAGAVSGQFEQPIGGFPVCGAGEPNASVDSCIDPNDSSTFIYRNTDLGTIFYDGTSPLSISFTFKTGNGVNCNFAPGAGGTESAKTPGLLSLVIANGS